MHILGRTGGGTVAPWSPADMTGCVLWLRADLGVTKDGSNLVSAWADQTSNGNDVAQPAGGSQPTWTDNVVNGYPVITFEGAQNLYKAVFSQAHPYTVYVVLRSRKYSTMGVVGGLAASVYHSIASTNYRIASGGTVRSLAQQVSWGFRVVSFYANYLGSSNEVVKVMDGAIGIPAQAGATGMSNIYIGSYSNGANFLTGDIAEIIVINGAYSASDEADLYDYMVDRYNMLFGRVLNFLSSSEWRTTITDTAPWEQFADRVLTGETATIKAALVYHGVASVSFQVPTVGLLVKDAVSDSIMSISSRVPLSYFIAANTVPGGAPVLLPGDTVNGAAVLLFPAYTSSTIMGYDTSFTITNVGSIDAMAHIYMIPNTGTPVEFLQDFTPGQVATFSCLLTDPDITGHLLVYAVDANGEPLNNNCFTGSAACTDALGTYIYTATKIRSLRTVVYPGGLTSQMAFDGVDYEQLPWEVQGTAESIADNPSQRLLISRYSEDLTTSQVNMTGIVGSFTKL
jgi:hypothetical protein